MEHLSGNIKFEDNFNGLKDINDRNLSFPPMVPPRSNLSIIQNPNMNYNQLYPSYPNNYFGGGASYGLYNQNYTPGMSNPMIDNQFMNSFSSINNAVQSFNALNMLVNTAYGAMYTSISTLANASEQISRTKDQLTHILSSINIFKIIKRLVIYIKRIFSGEFSPSITDISSFLGEFTRSFTNTPTGTSSGIMSILFFITIICGPIVIYKFIKNASSPNIEKELVWNSQIGKSYAAKVKADFVSRNPDELTVRAGEIVTIAPPEFQKEVNWYLVSNLKCKQGVIPASFVNVMGVLDKSKNQSDVKQ